VTARGEPVLTAAQQAFCLRASFPSGVLTLRCNCLSWCGIVRPTVLSEDYHVLVTYAVGHFPVVRVLSPALLTRDEGRLPHYFREGSLCLHERHEWGPSMRLVDTTLPWTVEWLAHYELWQATGRWYGDGDEQGRQLHGSPDTTDDLSRWARRRIRDTLLRGGSMRQAA
jgi:hypothetical protein